MYQKLYWVQETAKEVTRGTKLYKEIQTNIKTPVIVNDYEVGDIQGQQYLLCNKSVAEYMGFTFGVNGYSFYYNSADGIFSADEQGNLKREFILQKGVKTNKGIIESVGDKFVAIREKNNLIHVFDKQEIEPIEDEEVPYDRLQKSRIFYQELKTNISPQNTPHTSSHTHAETVGCPLPRPTVSYFFRNFLKPSQRTKG